MKRRIYLTLIIVFLLISLISGFIILPLFYQIRKNSREMVSQKEKLAGLEAQILGLEKFKILDKDLQYFLREVDNLFVDSKVPIEFIGFLENTSQKSRLETEILSVSGKKQEKDSPSYLTFQLSSVGSFYDFLKFLEKIENGPYLIELQSIVISREKEAEVAQGKIRAVFSFNILTK